MGGMLDPIPPEALLADFAPPTVDARGGAPVDHEGRDPRRRRAGPPRLAADRLRRARRRGTRYVAWIFPERVHVHLGFVQGVLIHDPDRRLEGRGEAKNARWLTWRPGEPIDAEEVEALIREAVRVTTLPREERFALAMAMAEEPPG